MFGNTCSARHTFGVGELPAVTVAPQSFSTYPSVPLVGVAVGDFVVFQPEIVGGVQVTIGAICNTDGEIDITVGNPSAVPLVAAVFNIVFVVIIRKTGSV